MAYSGSWLRDTQPLEGQWHNPPAELHMRVLLSHRLSLHSVINARVLDEGARCLPGHVSMTMHSITTMHDFGSVLEHDRKCISPR
jgi:hypothetical protein